MKINKQIQIRLHELDQIAQEILSVKVIDYFTADKKAIYKINQADFQGWVVQAINILDGVFGKESVYSCHFKQFFEPNSRGQSDTVLEGLNSILIAATEDYEKGYIFNTQGLIQAEVFIDVLEQSSELLSSGYKDPACVVAGVALETSLKTLCERNNIPQSKLDRMNTDLYKAKIYNLGMQKQITAWADRRNNAAHGNWNEYSENDVKEMIQGVSRFIAEYN